MHVCRNAFYRYGRGTHHCHRNTQINDIKNIWQNITLPFLPLSPLGWRGTILSYWSVPDFAESISLEPLDRYSPFKVLWNCPDPKLCDIMVYCPFAHMSLPMGQKLVKSDICGIQTLLDTYFQNRWTNLFYSKFYGIDLRNTYISKAAGQIYSFFYSMFYGID